MQNKGDQHFFSFMKGTDMETGTFWCLEADCLLIQTIHFINTFSDLVELLDETAQECTKHVIMHNFSLDELRTYLENNMDLDDAQRKLVFKYWKTHGANIMQIIERPVSNYTQGISNIDWEIH